MEALADLEANGRARRVGGLWYAAGVWERLRTVSDVALRAVTCPPACTPSQGP